MKARSTIIATVILLIASTIITVPANAQRRTGSNTSVKQQSEQESNTDANKKTRIAGKKASSENIRNENPSARRTPAVQKQPVAHEKNKNQVHSSRRSSAQETNARHQPANPAPPKQAAVQRKPANARQAAERQAPVKNNQEVTRYNGSVRNSSINNAPPNARARAEHNRTLYRIDSKDNRYIPAKTFKGNKNNWTTKHATYHVHYEKRDANFYRHYDHRKYNHWNPAWEHYRWNVNSWREYYSGYHPQSYRFHKHYFYHPAYGHVIRKFNYKPAYFVHNNVRYYNYNGHFFRHFKGLGYVLVDMPYGLVFHKLPAGYERVYVNGYLYFRVGNLFFESNPAGFALIHYPERYFALDANYYNGGYYRAVDYSVRF